MVDVLVLDHYQKHEDTEEDVVAGDNNNLLLLGDARITPRLPWVDNCQYGKSDSCREDG